MWTKLRDCRGGENFVKSCHVSSSHGFIVQMVVFLAFSPKQEKEKNSRAARTGDRNRRNHFPGTVRSIFQEPKSGPGKGVITKGVFPLENSLESLKSLNSLESLGNGRNLLCFPQSGGSLETLDSLISLESLENGLF